jgi:hypothetical protein
VNNAPVFSPFGALLAEIQRKQVISLSQQWPYPMPHKQCGTYACESWRGFIGWLIVMIAHCSQACCSMFHAYHCSHSLTSQCTLTHSVSFIRLHCTWLLTAASTIMNRLASYPSSI